MSISIFGVKIAFPCFINKQQSGPLWHPILVFVLRGEMEIFIYILKGDFDCSSTEVLLAALERNCTDEDKIFVYRG